MPSRPDSAAGHGADGVHLTRAQARAVDRIAVETFSMPSILLMENAARSAAVLAGRLLREVGGGGEILILVGPGNNGGDGLALGRFLRNAGREVTLACLRIDQASPGDAAVQQGICRAMGMTFETAAPALLARPAALVVDSLFGTGLSRPPEGVALALIAAVNVMRQHRPDCPVLAMDIPSGLDADTGEPLSDAVVHATHTITFAAPKVGFRNPASRAFTGEILVGDIGVPRAAIELARRQTP